MLAEWATPGPAARRSRGRRQLAAICAAAVLAVGAWAAWTLALLHAGRCDVSFITEPYEAKIYLDGVLQRDRERNAYTTPCTVPNLRARTCRVAFECAGLPRWDAGTYDLARTQQIVARPP